MPNRNGQGPDNRGPKTGRGLGACRINSRTTETDATGVQQQETSSPEYPVGFGCRGPRGCGNGTGGRRGGGSGGRRRQ